MANAKKKRNMEAWRDMITKAPKHEISCPLSLSPVARDGLMGVVHVRFWQRSRGTADVELVCIHRWAWFFWWFMVQGLRLFPPLPHKLEEWLVHCCCSTQRHACKFVQLTAGTSSTKYFTDDLTGCRRKDTTNPLKNVF